MKASRNPVATPHAPQAIGPYAQAIEATGTQWVFTSGQIALDPATGAMIEGDVEEQTKQVLRNLEAVLTAAGAGWPDVVKATIYLKDMNDFAAVNKVYAERFEGQVPPARSTVEVARLPKDARVEIDLIALRP